MQLHRLAIALSKSESSSRFTLNPTFTSFSTLKNLSISEQKASVTPFFPTLIEGLIRCATPLSVAFSLLLRSLIPFLCTRNLLRSMPPFTSVFSLNPPANLAYPDTRNPQSQ